MASGGSYTDTIWEDRQINFDMADKHLACRAGEVVIDRLDGVEDTKGNNGEVGKMLITNLRLIWHSVRNKSTNLSVGYHCILNITQKTAHSRLRGRTEALYVLTNSNSGESRFEFIFTNLLARTPRLFASVRAVHKAYESTKLYREVKLRAALINGGKLQLLHDEQIFTSQDGVWNLSTDTGNLGVFIVTNIRLVWHATANTTFNISIPYARLRGARIRESKFGPALVLEVKPSGGGYVLGFRVDPLPRLHELYQEIITMCKVFKENPIFGVRFQHETPGEVSEVLVPRVPASLVADTDQEDMETANDAYLAYFADGDRQGGEVEVVFNEELQLAMEKLPRDVSLTDLWEIHAGNKKTKKDKDKRLKEACGERS